MLLSLWQHCSRYCGHIAVFCSIAVLLISIKGRKHVITLVGSGEIMQIWRLNRPESPKRCLQSVCFIHSFSLLFLNTDFCLAHCRRPNNSSHSPIIPPKNSTFLHCNKLQQATERGSWRNLVLLSCSEEPKSSGRSCSRVVEISKKGGDFAPKRFPTGDISDIWYFMIFP